MLKDCNKLKMTIIVYPFKNMPYLYEKKKNTHKLTEIFIVINHGEKRLICVRRIQSTKVRRYIPVMERSGYNRTHNNKYTKVKQHKAPPARSNRPLK